MSLPGASAADLRAFPNRQRVRIADVYSKISSLEVLADWVSLRDLGMEDTPLKSLKGIENLVNLRRFTLGLGWNRRASIDISALEGVGGLEYLQMGIVDPVESLAPVAQVNNLKWLGMFHRDEQTARRIEEIEFSKLSHLESLTWWSKADAPPKLESLEFLIGSSSLKKVDFSSTEIACSLDPLLELKNLQSMSFTTDLTDEVEVLRRSRPGMKLRVSKPFRPRQPDLLLGIVKINHIGDLGGWTIFQDMTGSLQTASNHESDRLIKKAVMKADEALYARLEFDPEADHVSITASSEEDIRAVAAIINGMIQPSDDERME